MDDENDALEPRLAHMQALFKQEPSLDSLMTECIVARINHNISMKRYDYSMVPFHDLKDSAILAVCRRIHYAEQEVHASYTDEQLIDKIKSDIQRELQSMQQYGLPPTRAG